MGEEVEMEEFIQVIQQDLGDKREKLTEEKADGNGAIEENRSVPEPETEGGTIRDQPLTNTQTKTLLTSTQTPANAPNSTMTTCQSQ